jgi:pentose-5-phosphate-3-epimerase
MPIICPTITTSTEKTYRQQMERVSNFAHSIHIDLTDGIFAEPKTISAEQAWWPVGVKADFHIMYKDPEKAARILAAHNPHLIIVHAEADGNFEAFADFCQQHYIKVGVALLQQTSAEEILPVLDSIDHVLIFSGNLGHQGGGHVDLGLLDKIKLLKDHKSNLEIGWDGGVNDQNISHLAFAGVDVINVGSFIHKADDPEKAYNAMQRIADETGET